jgi:hypothetical protein
MYTVVHFGDATSYYGEINLALRSPAYDSVYHELITSRANMKTDPATSLTYLAREVGPTRAAFLQARSLGLTPQLDQLDVSNGWIADLTVEEMRLIAAEAALSRCPAAALSDAANDGYTLSAVASVSRASALLLRTMCIFLPCPELNVLLLDSIDPRSLFTPPVPLSLLALFRGDFLQAKRLLFGQLVQRDTMARANVRLDDVVTAARNQRIVQAMRMGAKKGFRNVAVVVGAFHGDQLGRLFENSFNMEYKSSTWQTVMECGPSSPWTKFWTAPESAAVPLLLFAGCFLAVLGVELLALIDWCRTLHLLAESLESGVKPTQDSSMARTVGLYFMRHLGVYIFLRRWFQLQVSTVSAI